MAMAGLHIDARRCAIAMFLGDAVRLAMQTDFPVSDTDMPQRSGHVSVGNKRKKAMYERPQGERHPLYQ
jgi:hypothetical protein